jgi:hypothetical protein
MENVCVQCKSLHHGAEIVALFNKAKVNEIEETLKSIR